MKGFREIKTLNESLREKVLSGKMTIREAAREFCRCGWTNFVDEEFTIRTLKL